MVFSMPNHIGDDEQVTVWGLTEIGSFRYWNKGISAFSPYVSRVEAYLRLIKQPYVKARSLGLSENPCGKAPFANVKGCVVADSAATSKTIHNFFQVLQILHSLWPGLCDGRGHFRVRIGEYNYWGLPNVREKVTNTHLKVSSSS
jgi:hypothetical protein